MRDFDDTTLWRISAYERLRADTGGSGFAPLGSPSALATTLVAELRELARAQRDGAVLDVVAACIRQRENALVLLRLGGFVWPLTLFPRNGIYQAPRPIVGALRESTHHDLRVLSVEPSGLRPAGHHMHERIANPESYHPLPALLWALALHAPEARLLPEISGRAAYRLGAGFAFEGLESAGAVAGALARLRHEIAPLETIAHWPGMDRDRATRLLNGAYLQGGLIVLRTHASARKGEGTLASMRRWLRERR